MGIASSAGYHSLEGKPVIAPVVQIWSEGSEYVRFIDTIWTQILQPDLTSPEKPRHVFKRAKAIVVQGQNSGEIHYLSRDALVSALGGDLHKVSQFVNPKKTHEIYVHWFLGNVTDPKSGRMKESCYLIPTPDEGNGLIMRRIDPENDISKASTYTQDLKEQDDFRIDDVILDHKSLTDDMDAWIVHTPILWP